MHKLNTTTWTTWMIAAAIICSLTYHPLYLTTMLATLILLCRLLQIPSRGHIKTGILFSTPLLLINTLFIHTGEHTLTTIPTKIAGIPLPLIAGPVTLESIYAGTLFMLLMTVMLLLFMIYQNQVTPDEIIRLIPQKLSHSAILTAITLRFIPTLTADAHSISEANRSRGLRLEDTTLTRKIRNQASLIIPTLENAIERSYNLAEALESRGYGRKRTKYGREKWTTKDKTLTTLYALTALAFITLTFAGVISSQSPFRVEDILKTPQANPIILATILSFTLPGVRK